MWNIIVFVVAVVVVVDFCSVSVVFFSISFIKSADSTLFSLMNNEHTFLLFSISTDDDRLGDG